MTNAAGGIEQIRRRWAAVTSTDWKRLQHWIEDENDFSANARGDIAWLLAALDRRERAAVALVAAVRAVASWDEGTGRADLLEALADYDEALAGEGVR